MTPKELRIIDKNLGILFTDKAYKIIKTIDDLKGLGLFPEKITVKEKELYLSEIGSESLKKITVLILSKSNFKNYLTFDEIYNELKIKIGKALVDRQYEVKEFIFDLLSTIELMIVDHTAMYCIKGISINCDTLQLGNVKIIKKDKLFFDSLNLHKNIHPQSIYENMNAPYWLIVNVRGSKKVAKQNSLYRATIFEGILNVYAIIFYKNAIQKIRVQVQNEYSNNSKTHFSLIWPSEDTSNAMYYTKFTENQSFNFNQDMINEAKLNLFFDEYSEILDKVEKSEIDESILRSTYWIAESVKDNNNTMKFIKLWTAIECFFSVNSHAGTFKNGGIAELNATGLSTILTFGPYRLVDHKKYSDFKKNIKKLYVLRSKAIHAGFHQHISDKDLNDLSYWTAYLVISLVALSKVGGYIKLNDIYAQSERLNNI